jgi:hypothetical protein
MGQALLRLICLRETIFVERAKEAEVAGHERRLGQPKSDGSARRSSPGAAACPGFTFSETMMV